MNIDESSFKVVHHDDPKFARYNICKCEQCEAKRWLDEIAMSPQERWQEAYDAFFMGSPEHAVVERVEDGVIKKIKVTNPGSGYKHTKIKVL